MSVTHHARMLEKLIMDQRGDLVESIISGRHSQTDYARLCGVLQGLETALTLSKQADNDLSGELSGSA